jgi:hypothetical protein
MLKVKSLTKRSWYYKNNLFIKGPFSKKETINFIKKEIIDQNTLIMKKGSEDWIRAIDSELTGYFKFNKMPPLKGTLISSAFAWGLAFTPVIGGLFQSYMVNNNLFLTDELSSYHWFIPLVLSIFLCFIDKEALKKDGYNIKKVDNFAWLPPMYLFRRAKLLNSSPYSSFLWIIFFFIFLFT